jgi:hypothetical protein
MRFQLGSGRVWAFLASIVILKVTASVVSGYHAYVPPDFSSDFLRGREAQFFGPYQWAFYTHIVSGPISLVLGLILLAERSWSRFPMWHRVLGRIQVACVLLFVTPSGLWMAYHAAAGPMAAVGLAMLALVTATCVSLGARFAIQRRFADHRRWMCRGYALLCSAVILRLLGGLGTVMGVDNPWFDPIANWVSWLAPLAGFEIYERVRRERDRCTFGR